MTGGLQNLNASIALAEACNELGIAMVLDLRDQYPRGECFRSTWSVRNAIGERPLFANFGAVNLPQLDAIQDLGRISTRLKRTLSFFT